MQYSETNSFKLFQQSRIQVLGDHVVQCKILHVNINQLILLLGDMIKKNFNHFAIDANKHVFM